MTRQLRAETPWLQRGRRCVWRPCSPGEYTIRTSRWPTLGSIRPGHGDSPGPVLLGIHAGGKGGPHQAPGRDPVGPSRRNGLHSPISRGVRDGSAAFGQWREKKSSALHRDQPPSRFAARRLSRCQETSAMNQVVADLRFPRVWRGRFREGAMEPARSAVRMCRRQRDCGTSICARSRDQWTSPSSSHPAGHARDVFDPATFRVEPEPNRMHERTI